MRRMGTLGLQASQLWCKWCTCKHPSSISLHTVALVDPGGDPGGLGPPFLTMCICFIIIHYTCMYVLYCDAVTVHGMNKAKISSAVNLDSVVVLYSYPWFGLLVVLLKPVYREAIRTPAAPAPPILDLRLRQVYSTSRNCTSPWSHTSKSQQSRVTDYIQTGWKVTNTKWIWNSL